MTRPLVAVLGKGASSARAVGLGHIARRLRDAVDAPLVRSGRPPLKATMDGATIRGFLRHRSFLAEVARTGTTYRPLFVASLRPGMTVVDGGAHVGTYSLLAARAVGAGGLVVALEPDPYNLRALEHNVAGCANVRVVPKALADGPGAADFYVSAGTTGSSLALRTDTEAGTRVELTGVDAELRGRELSSLLVKLNVEGAELRALAGMRETLDRCADVTMFVEVNPAVVDPPELLGRLDELGFDVYRIEQQSQSLWRLPPGTTVGKGHVYCRRR